MADAITIKALQDASLDAKSLEEVVNGNESKQVTTRLGENYPSVKKAINIMFQNGGLPAAPFATKALMTASSLANDKYAMVTDDTVNNGLYVKTSGAWVKSGYDPLVQAKSYATTKDEELELRLTNKPVSLNRIPGFIPDTNLFKSDTVQLTKFVVDTTGELKSNASFPTLVASDYIEIKPSTAYSTNSGYRDTPSSLYAQYTADKVYISGGKGGQGFTNPIITAPNAKYIIFNISENYVPVEDFVLVEGASLPSVIKPQSFTWLDDSINFAIGGAAQPNDIARFKGKNFLVTGDSITDANNAHTTKWWHGFLKEWLSLGVVQNDGVSGSGIARSGSGQPGIYDRIDDWKTKYSSPDVILIMGNMNDAGIQGDSWTWQKSNKGDFTTVVTKTNRYGSLWFTLRYLFEGILALYPNTPIGFITSQPRGGEADSINSVSPDGYTSKRYGANGFFAEWVDVIKLVASHYSIPVLDLYNESNMRPWIPANNTEFFSNGDMIHPNIKGHEVMARRILPFVKQFC